MTVATETETGDQQPAAPTTPVPAPDALPNNFRGSSSGAPITAEGGGAPAPERPRVTVEDLGGSDSEALKARIERVQRQLSREIADTDDPVEAKKKVAEWRANEEKLRAAEEELKKHRENEEKRKRAVMSESQRAAEDLKRMREENELLKKQLVDKDMSIAYAQQNSAIEGIAKELISPKLLKYAKRELAEHVNSLDKKKIERFGEREVRKFFEKFVEDNPEFAASKEAAPASKPVVRRPIGANGSKTPATPPTPKPRSTEAGEVNGKTFKPGQANSMTRSEVRAQAAKMGVRWPG